VANNSKKEMREMESLKYFAIGCKIREEKVEEAYKEIKSLLINRFNVREIDIKPTVEDVRR